MKSPIKRGLIRCCFQIVMPSVGKSYRFAPQKESFHTLKGVLLQCKRTPFEHQKLPFWKAKVALC